MSVFLALMLALAVYMIFRLGRRIEMLNRLSMLELLSEEPQYGIGLLAKHHFVATSVHRRINVFLKNGWIKRCDPPENASEWSRDDSYWYAITVAGQKQIEYYKRRYRR